MKIYKLISILFTIGILTISCEDFFEMNVDLDIDEHESKLAVTSFISNETNEKSVLVSYSIGGLEEATDNQLINDAIVTLSMGNTSYEMSNTEADGIYTFTNSIEFTPNAEYTLTVEASNYKTVTAKQIFPKSVEIINAFVINKKLKIRFQDDPNKRNYYSIELNYFDSDTDRWDYVWLDSDESTTFWSTTTNGVIFNDDTFNGNEHEITIPFDTYFDDVSQNPVLFKAKLYNVTEDLYKYDRTLSMSYDFEDTPFVEPVILHRNIENGYGIFGMMNLTEFEFEEPAN